MCSVLRACLSLNSSGVHGEDRPYGAVPGEPINYRAVTLGRLRFVIDASCAAGVELSHAAKGKGHAADRPGGRWQEGQGGEVIGPSALLLTHGYYETTIVVSFRFVCVLLQGLTQ